MRIEIADSIGRSEPQFIVYAESHLDELILKSFLTIKSHSKMPLSFCLHGFCFSDGKYKSFNFGWREEEKVSEKPEPYNISQADAEPGHELLDENFVIITDKESLAMIDTVMLRSDIKEHEKLELIRKILDKKND